MRSLWSHGLAPLLVLAALAGPARAGLFDDDEARRAILDLRARLTAVEEAAAKRLTEQQATQTQLSDEVQQLRRSLLLLNNQIEALKIELASLRGTDEQLARDVSDLQRRQKDFAQGVDERVRRLEPQKVSLDGREFLADPEEKTEYESALALLRAGDFDKAAEALATFAKRHPSSGYTDSVRFWLGNAHYGRKGYKEAIASFRAFVAAAPDHVRAPEALLAIANCQAEMRDVRSARRTIDELIKSYPNSEAAAAGKERLAGLKG